MASLRFSHTAIACKDPIAVERFYTQYFGFKRARVLPLGEEQIVFIKSGDVYLEIFQAKEEAPVPAPENDGPWYPGWRHIAFQVDDVDAKLAEIGDDANITLGPLNFDDFIPGWRTVWVADPEGNIVEITQGYTDEDHPPIIGST
ncbi:MAG: VOC family protein [Candidatus Bipolaricaulia bacterium]